MSNFIKLVFSPTSFGSSISSAYTLKITFLPFVESLQTVCDKNHTICCISKLVSVKFSSQARGIALTHKGIYLMYKLVLFFMTFIGTLSFNSPFKKAFLAFGFIDVSLLIYN